jgi:penicillin-insensitive murein endopeptidase
MAAQLQNAALIATGLAALVAGCASQPKPNPWSLVSGPTHTQAVSIGSYSAGCVEGAISMTPDGDGYQMMRLSRRRFYGHPGLIAFIQDLARKTRREKLAPLLVGDIGMPRGGPTLTGHKSHQTGLDVDLWFFDFPAARNRSLTLDERENLSAPSMVVPGGDGVQPLFGKRQRRLLELAAAHPDVERVFVNPAIKRELCRSLPQKPKKRAWLQKLRPWWGHDAHFHVRLRCPADAPLCITQETLAPGDGCDETLDWWFSDEAREELRKQAEEKPSGPPPMPELPEACKPVIDAA